jgi:hypothetical protein
MHATGFMYVNLKEGYHLEHLCTSERIILKLILKTKWKGTEWIYLAPETRN